ncbi:uncharacterized protein [Watersipora subatra]|uniref:uncharacterized protein n=1 Tax=Watersipora subatra TaxID=2589382 RepID=UPI00355BA36C
MHSLSSIYPLQLLEEQDPTADGDILISKENATTGEGGIAGSKEMLEEETNRKQTLENLIAENKFLREQNRRLKEESECKDSKIDELKTVIKDFTCFMKSIDEKLAQVLKNDDSAKALMEENTLLKEQNRLLQEELKSLKKISETHSQEIRELKDQRDDARRVHLVQNQDSQLRNSLARVVNRHNREIETNQNNITAVRNTADAAKKRADEAVELGHTNATAVNSAIEGLNEQMMSGAGGLQQNQDG